MRSIISISTAKRLWSGVTSTTGSTGDAVQQQRGQQPVVVEGAERLLGPPDLRHDDLALALAGEMEDRPGRRVGVEIERGDDIVVLRRGQIRIPREHCNGHTVALLSSSARLRTHPFEGIDRGIFDANGG